jgi:hypothetical protein
LPVKLRLNQHLNVGRRLVEDGRKDDALHVLRLGLDIAGSDPAGTKCNLCGMVAAEAINAGDSRLATRAVRMAVANAITQPTPALSLSYILAIRLDQLSQDNQPEK